MKKVVLMLFLFAGATTFASTGEVIVKPLSAIVKVEVKPEVVVKTINCRLECFAHPEFNITYTASSNAEAVTKAQSICPSGGQISTSLAAN